MRSVTRFLCLVVATASIAVLTALPARGSQVRLVNLEQMTERAERIFAGRCIESAVVLDPAVGREITVSRFAVERAAKGDLGDTVSVRMIGGDDAAGGTAGLPRFRVGDEVVLFLYGESALGLSSPVGLGQGRFKVVNDKLGRPVAVNDFANENVLRGVSAAGRTRLGSSFEQWQERKDFTPVALLDMVEALEARP